MSYINRYSFRRHALFNADAFLRIETSGIAYPAKSYSHSISNEQNRYLFEYIVSGKGYIDLDNKRQTVDAGNFVMIKFIDNIRYFSDSDDPYTKIWFTATGKFVEGLVHSFGVEDSVVMIRRNMFAQFEDFLAFIDSADFTHNKASVKLLELLLYAFNGKKDDISPSSMSISEQIKSYIDIHFHEKITMNDLCIRFNCSDKTLVQHFSEFYGLSPNRYLRRLRLDSAKSMLTGSSYTVAEIAALLGYCSAPHLSKDFCKEFGVYPTEYRKNSK